MATTSLRSILSRGWSLDEPEVWQGFLSTIIWIAAFLIITITVLKLKRN